jgi:uncharacterized protein
MKPILILLIGLGCFLGCGKDIKVWTQKDTKGNLIEEYEYYNHPENNKKIRDGWYNSYYYNGNYKSIGIYKDDVKDGKWTQYDINGKTTCEGEYREGKEWEGVFLKEGSLLKGKNRYAYRNGKRHGKFIGFNENGKIRNIGHFEDDKEHGEWVWFDMSGKIKSSYLKENDITKLWITYYKNGQKKMEVSDMPNSKDFKNIYRGLWIDYDENGNKRNGKWKIIEEEYGSIVKEEGSSINGLRDGEFRKWDSSGNLVEISNYKNGRRHGKTQRKFEDRDWIVTYWDNGRDIDCKENPEKCLED